MIESRAPHPVYCQACGAGNPDDQEFCRRCHHKLLVVSGSRGNERDDLLAELEEDFSFDEHLLERISLLEEAVKRSTETVEHLIGVTEPMPQANRLYRKFCQLKFHRSLLSLSRN